MPNEDKGKKNTLIGSLTAPKGLKKFGTPHDQNTSKNEHGPNLKMLVWKRNFPVSTMEIFWCQC